MAYGKNRFSHDVAHFMHDLSFDNNILSVRLTGSTTVNYGRLEVYHNDDADWLAVCDYGLNINEANVLCRMLGYNTGLFQRGSPLGPTNQPITISEVDCISQSTCTFKKGDCRSGKYVTLYCSEGVITTEGMIFLCF